MNAKTVLKSTIVNLTLIMLVAVAVATPAGAEMFRYNAQHTGDYSAVAGSASNGLLKWSSQTDTSWSSPAVVGDHVYVGGLSLRPGVNPVGTVRALSAADGSLIWATDLGNMAYTSPAVVDGVVYVGAEAQDTGYVVALNAASGNVIWGTGIGHYPTSPTVVKGVVYAGSFSGIDALDAVTGHVLWNNQLGGARVSETSPAVANDVVYVPCSDGNLYALSAADGGLIWSKPVQAFQSSPAVANDIVYVGSNTGTVYAFNAQTGSPVWSKSIGVQVLSSPAIVNDVVYVGSNTGIYALSAANGNELWGTPIATQSSPAVANGVLYVGSSDGLYALSAATGTPIWNYPMGQVLNSPAVANGVVFVGRSDGDTFGLRYFYAIGNQMVSTTLTISVNPTNPLPNQRIDLYGTLTSGPGVTRLANQKVYLERSVDSGQTWNLVSTTPATTNTGGVYAFYGVVPNQPGTYLYRAHFNATGVYAESYSTQLTFTIPQRATQLSISQVPTSPAAKQPVNVIGNLTTAGAGSARLHNQKLYLEQSTDGGVTWTLVSLTPATTINGAYTFLAPIKVPGTYLVRTHFNGTVQYDESWSSQLTLTVK